MPFFSQNNKTIIDLLFEIKVLIKHTRRASRRSSLFCFMTTSLSSSSCRCLSSSRRRSSAWCARGENKENRCKKKGRIENGNADFDRIRRVRKTMPLEKKTNHFQVFCNLFVGGSHLLPLPIFGKNRVKNALKQGLPCSYLKLNILHFQKRWHWLSRGKRRKKSNPFWRAE